MYSLYIHIPFCVKKCAYCDFYSVALPSECREKKAALYVDALLKEADLYSERFSGICFDSVFLGGGTPSLLPEGLMKKLFSGIRERFDISCDAEITTELNPGTITESKLCEYKASGINRLSIGLQAAQDTLLRSIGRIHVYEDFLWAVDATKRAGFTNINADIMYGLPGQTTDNLLETAKKAIRLELPHISAYSLILEEGTLLYEQVENGERTLPGEDETAKMQDMLTDLLSKNGYGRYEISNYAKPGFMCRHNLNYWDNGRYLGLGAAAHSAYLENGVLKRSYNYADIDKYISLIKNGDLPSEHSEFISQKEEMFETVMLGLRKTSGISISAFSERFAKDLRTVYQKALEKLVNERLLEITADSVFLTPRGLDIQNIALLEFLE